MTSRRKVSMMTFSMEFVFKILITLLGIVKTRMLIQFMGDDINGLYQLVIQLLAFVTIADLGLDSIYRFAYYKPLHDGNRLEVNRIYNSSVIFYKRVGFVMIGLSILISFVLPLLTSTKEFNTMTLMFIMLCFSLPSVVEAFYSADISLVSAQQKNYLVHFLNNIKYVTRLVISVITLLTSNFILFIVIDSLIAIVFTMVRYFTLRKHNDDFKNLTQEVNNAPVKLTKYTLFFSVNNTVYNNTDNIVITSLMGLNFVSVYSSYYFVIKALSDVITISFGSIVDSIGDLFASAKNQYKTFTQMEDILFYIAIFLACPLFLGLSSFIRLAIASSDFYQINAVAYNCFTILFIVIILSSIWEVLIKANGLYRETWKVSLVESTLNIVVSIALGSYLGFSGILFGTICAKLVKLIYYQFVLGKKLEFNILRQIQRQIKNFVYLVLMFILLNYLLSSIVVSSLIQWILIMVIVAIVSGTLHLGFMVLLYPDFREFIFSVVHRRK